LIFVAGAILVFFATHVLLPAPSSADAGDLRAHYFNVNRQFFSFLALLQIWILGVDFLFGDGFISASVFNVVALALFGVLALSPQSIVHSIGTVAGWLLFVAMFVARGLGLLS